MNRAALWRKLVVCFTSLLLVGIAGSTGSKILFAQNGDGEPNNTFGTATELPATGAVTGAITPLQDADWYKLSVDGHGELAFQVTNVAAELDISARLWNSNKDVISEWFAPLAKGGDTEAAVDLPAAGVFYLEVRDGSDDAAAEQPYTLATTFALSPDLAEPNNDFGQAATLSLDQPQLATILPVRDADWLAVTVDSHGELNLAITGVPADLEVVLRLWNGNKDVLTNWFAPLAKGGDTTAAVDLPAPGRYYIEIRDSNDDARSVQPFTVTASFSPSPDALESNNGFGQATALTLGQPATAAILPTGDDDWYAFEAPGHGELQVVVSNVPMELDIAFRLWNSNKDVLTNWYAPLAKGGNTEAVIDLPAAGRYFLEVSDGNDDARSVQPYHLQTLFTPSPDEFEPNQDFGHAVAIGVDRSIQATILPAGDADWFSFLVDRHGELTVQVSSAPADMDVVFRLWNNNKDVLTNWFAPLAKGGNTEAVIDLPEPGRYFLEARDGNDDARSITPFTLSTTFTPSTELGEPNNTFESATPGLLDTSIAGTILPAGDRDWYLLELAGAGDLHVLVTNVAPELAITFRLWDEAQNVMTNWFTPLSKGGNTEAAIPIATPGRYILEVADNSGAARSIQPYLLRFGMAPIDPATVTLPALPTPTGATGSAGTGATTPTTPVTGTETLSPTADVTILTSGQVGPFGAELFVQEPANPAVDGARLTIPPESLATLETVHISVSDRGPAGAPFGLQPAGPFWIFEPDGLTFLQPVTITLPVPVGAAEPAMFVGHWTGNAWEDLGGEVVDGLISVQSSGFSTYGVFCGNVGAYRDIRLVNESSSPYVELHYVSGPSPDPEDPDADFSAGCPLPTIAPEARQIPQNESEWLMLRPGRYHFVVAYPQPQPGTANSLFVTVRPGDKQVTIRLTDEGATGDAPEIAIDFPGREIVAGTNVRPVVACDATVPAGVTLASWDPAAPALPSRIVAIPDIKLEQLPAKGPGIDFRAVATDPEGGALRTYWTTSGPASKSTIAGDGVASGAPIAGQYEFRATTGGTFTVYLTVYDELGLFDECRWVITVLPNQRPQIDVIAGRTFVEFGRLDEVRQSEGVGPIVPALSALRPGAAAPVTVPAQATPGASVVWSGLSLCPDSVAGPFTQLPAPPESVLAAPAPVDMLLAPTGTDVTNRWAFAGRTCVWAVVADGDSDPLSIGFEFPGPIFGSGTFYAAVDVPPGFATELADGIVQGGLIRTNEQLAAYNAWISALYNTAGVIPAIVWEAWDDPCPPGSGDVQNPCPSSISLGGVENIVARVSDGFSSPPAIDYAPIGVGPDAVGDGGECWPVFFISSLTPSPSDPLPLQGVRVTARLSPVTEGCLVTLAVTGTDGYSDMQSITTNKSGEASLQIPGGAESVVDLVTAEVCVQLSPNAIAPPPAEQCTTATGLPGRMLRMEVSYSF